jgi:redox-sensitive bicupin YhaK (pirin superfamily)
MEHRDSRGHAGRLGPGDVQWMTAGAGVVHSEMPSEAFRRAGGRMHGFQLWVNLPRADKLMAPRYQEVPRARIPAATSPDGLVAVRVIAGDALGARAVIDTRTPIVYLHFTLRPGGEILQPVPRGHRALVYVFGGTALVGPEARPVRDGQAALLSDDGDAALLRAPAGAGEPTEALLLAGAPLGEPVARYGPFVMNTEAEIRQAIGDYRSGRMGAVGPGR